jgi:hypothetical protein
MIDAPRDLLQDLAGRVNVGYHQTGRTYMQGLLRLADQDPGAIIVHHHEACLGLGVRNNAGGY